jgi:hypothetical protein
MSYIIHGYRYPFPPAKRRGRLADGRLLPEEADYFLDIAKQVGYTEREGYQVLLAAAEAVGFKRDTYMKGVVKKVQLNLAKWR